jgi:hydrogenase maturation protease
MSEGKRTVVIGLGNPLMADDGLGLAALERLRASSAFGPDVELVDGGTWGMNLLPVVEEAGRVLLVDAIHAGAPPGTLVVLERHQLPRYLATRISPHQVDVADVLALAELRGTLPEDTIAVGLEPARVEMLTGLTPVVEAQLGRLVAAVLARLESWGHRAAPDEVPACTR